MELINIKVNFDAYYNEKKETFDGGLYPILEYIKSNTLKNAIVRLDVNGKNETSWEEVDLFCPELSIKELGYTINGTGINRGFTANIKCSPKSGKSLIKLLIMMGELGNGGHSYGILINDKKFFFDGDGADHISEINNTRLDSEIYSNTYKQAEIFKKGSNEEQNVNENIVKLTETDIKNIIKESVKKVLKNSSYGKR